MMVDVTNVTKNISKVYNDTCKIQIRTGIIFVKKKRTTIPTTPVLSEIQKEITQKTALAHNRTVQDVYVHDTKRVTGD